MKTQSTFIISDADSVYGYVKKISGDECETIEVSSWANIAYIGKSFEREEFSYTVEVVAD